MKGIIIAVENAPERNRMANPIVRKAATDENSAMVWLADEKPVKLITVIEKIL